MSITCISASNVEIARQHSASTRACEIIGELARLQAGPDTQVAILPLIDYELNPCRMCGKCLSTGRCVRDDAFNRVYEHMIAADAVFVVCPHYAPLPSKMMMLLEKLEEMVYLNWCKDNAYRSPLFRKPVGLVAHGGQTAEALPYYKTTLLDPLATAFGSVQMRVAPAGEGWPNGAVFGIQNLILPEGSMFVTIEHDWDDIQQRLQPLVHNVLHLSQN